MRFPGPGDWKFPLARAEELQELRDGEVWYLSPYTLFAYLKGHTDIARALSDDVTYNRTPQLPCVMGRHSCRLPADGWTMLRLERDGDRSEGARLCLRARVLRSD